MVASCNSAMEGWKNHFHSFYIFSDLIAALKWKKRPRDLTKIPQVHVGGDDEGEGEVELLVRHSAVLRPLEVTGLGQLTHVLKVSRQLSSCSAAQSAETLCFSRKYLRIS